MVYVRNLFYIFIVMYDVWVVYDLIVQIYFLGKMYGVYFCLFEGVLRLDNVDEVIKEVISYVCYNLLKYWFDNGRWFNGFGFVVE